MPITQATTVEDLPQELTSLKGLDSDEARTMPPSFYTSEDLLELEKEQICRPHWTCLGHVGEILNSGDFYTTELVGEQLLVSRGHDGDHP